MEMEKFSERTKEIVGRFVNFMETKKGRDSLVYFWGVISVDKYLECFFKQMKNSTIIKGLYTRKDSLDKFRHMVIVVACHIEDGKPIWNKFHIKEYNVNINENEGTIDIYSKYEISPLFFPTTYVEKDLTYKESKKKLEERLYGNELFENIDNTVVHVETVPVIRNYIKKEYENDRFFIHNWSIVDLYEYESKLSHKDYKAWMKYKEEELEPNKNVPTEVVLFTLVPRDRHGFPEWNRIYGYSIGIYVSPSSNLFKENYYMKHGTLGGVNQSGMTLRQANNWIKKMSNENKIYQENYKEEEEN